ncbi:MAG TPA: WYL domain-containing protein [Chloroflexota bacterium]|nr:WYL domain-containing protein [Chloroflexota bacterium]
MPTGDAVNRAARLRQILYLLTVHPDGLTAHTLAGYTGVHVRSIQRDLLALQTDEPRAPLVYAKRRWSLLPGRLLDVTRLELTLAEAVALYLAARLLDRASDEANRHVASLLDKLAANLQAPLAEHVAEDAREILDRSNPPAPGGMTFGDIFAVLARAWAGRRRVEVEYSTPRKPEPRLLQLDLYLLEPLAPGLAIYCYGLIHEYGEERWLKIERMRGARLLSQTFDPPTIDRRTVLRSGWGIMGGTEVITVHLRFGPRVVARVKESRWHETARIVDRTDGACDLLLEIAQTIEIVPWIRGWGPDCEVIAPVALRAQIAADARQTAALYPEYLPMAEEEGS